MSPDPEDLVRRIQETGPVEPPVPPAVFRSKSGRIVLMLKPWYDDDHDEMMREIDLVIAELQKVRDDDGGAA